MLRVLLHEHSKAEIVRVEGMDEFADQLAALLEFVSAQLPNCSAPRSPVRKPSMIASAARWPESNARKHSR